MQAAWKCVSRLGTIHSEPEQLDIGSHSWAAIAVSLHAVLARPSMQSLGKDLKLTDTARRTSAWSGSPAMVQGLMSRSRRTNEE